MAIDELGLNLIESDLVIPVNILISKVFGAALIFGIGLVAGRLIGKIVGRFVHKLNIQLALARAGIKTKIDVLVEYGVRYVIYLISLIIALNHLGITVVLLNILFIGFIAIVVIAVALSLKDFVPNIISGIYLLSNKDLQPGSKIRLNGTSGIIKEMNLVETKILTSAKNMIIIPNSLLTKSKITKLRGKA